MAEDRGHGEGKSRIASLFWGAGMAHRDDSLGLDERRRFGRNFESKAVVEVKPTRWRLSCKNARNSLPGCRRRKCRICRFCRSRQFSPVEKWDRHSENAKIAKITHCL